MKTFFYSNNPILRFPARPWRAGLLLETWALFLLLLLAGSNVRASFAAAAALSPQVPLVEGPFVSEASESHVVDLDLSTLPEVATEVPTDSVLEVPRALTSQTIIADADPAEPFVDPLLGEEVMLEGRANGALESRAHGALSAPIVNVDGVAFTGFVPPDPIIDVGPHHIIQMVNSVFAIFSKTGSLLAGPFAINSLWAGTAAPCATQNLGDPVVLYDHLADRWLVSQFASPSHVCIAVSRTGNPVTGGFFAYQFNVGSFPDYFKLGVWPDAYYMAANFEEQVTVVAFNRAQMLNGNPGNFVQFNVAGLPGLGGNMMLPSDLDGPRPPPAGSPNYFYRQVDGDNFGGADRIEIFEFRVNFANPALSTFTGPTNLPMAAFDSALCGFFSFACVPQPGTTTTLDPINEWPMWRLQYRNFGSHETLVGNFTVDVGADRAGIRWFELHKVSEAAWTIFQQGTFSPGTAHRWIGSIAMDRDRNIALGYSISSTTVFPSIHYTGRLSTDPLGRMPQGEENLINGSGFSTLNRWGDYSSLNIDPLDDCTFWYTNQYMAASGVAWRTRIGSFRFLSCGQTDLSIDMTDSPDPVGVGSELTYRLRIRNLGPSDATGVIVTDTLPGNVNFVSASSGCSRSGSTVTCNIGNMSDGESAVRLIRVRPSAPGGFSNTATVTANETDPDPANNTVTTVTTVK
jgi:uncharacterized repeat protein (TIGR01451 family)